MAAAVAHVAAEPTGVCFLPQPEAQLFYDEAAACMHLVEGRMITAIALPQPMYGAAAGAAGAGSRGSLTAGAAEAAELHGGTAAASGYDSDSSAASSTARAFLVSEGPPVRHIRSSLDGAFTALHRSARLVEVHCHATGNMFVETAGADKLGRKGGDPRLLGFFWTAAHFVMVTAGGLEIHTVHPSRQALRLDSTVPLQGVQWYTYSPETHMVVLGFGSSGAKLQAIQFSKAGTLRLPLLDLTPPWGSPIRPVMAAAVSAALDGFSAAREQPARLVGPDTCWVVVLYSRVLCVHHDRGVGVLRLYRMFRDATSLAYQYEVYARQLELSVVDNMLLVHHIDTAVVMLIDIMAAGPVPISSPLPLGVPLAVDQAQQLAGRALGGGSEAAVAVEAATGAGTQDMPAAVLADALHGGVAAEGGGDSGAAPTLAAASALQLHYPAWLVDGAGGIVYRLQLDLAAIADSQSDYPRLLAFLQRRRPSVVPRRDAASITLRVLRGLVQDEAPLVLLRCAFDVVNSVASLTLGGSSSSSGGSGSSSNLAQHAPRQAKQRMAAAAGGGGPGGETASPRPLSALQQRPVVTPQDAYNSMFGLLRAQQQVRPAYLQAALAEYVASCRAHAMAVAPSLAALYVDVLLDQGLPHLVAPLLLSHPLLDSVLLAEHVEEAAASGQLPGGVQLAEQLLVRQGAHEARCRLLLRRGQVRRALLVARQHHFVGLLAPAALLEAAAATGDVALFAAMHRMCGLQLQRPALGTLGAAAAAHSQHFQAAHFAALQSPAALLA